MTVGLREKDEQVKLAMCDGWASSKPGECRALLPEMSRRGLSPSLRGSVPDWCRMLMGFPDMSRVFFCNHGIADTSTTRK